MSLNPVRVVARFPRPVRLLLVGTLVNKLGTFIVPYLTLVLLRDFRMAEGEVALLLFAYGTGSVVSILAGGVLTDLMGRRRTLLLSLLGSGALAVLMALLPSKRLFVPLLVAFGFIADLYRPAASALIGDLLPSSERATGFAGLRMAVNLGWASGTALGFGMIGLVMHWAWFLLAVVVFTLGEILSAPQQMAFVADWAPPEARGRYLSLYQATWSIAFALNPALTLPLHKALGERWFWGLMPLVALPGVIVLLRLDATVDRPERLRGLSHGPTLP